MIVLIGLLWLWDEDKSLRVQRGSRDPLGPIRAAGVHAGNVGGLDLGGKCGDGEKKTN